MSVADNLIQALEKKVNDLIELSRELNRENRALKLRAAELQRERREGTLAMARTSDPNSATAQFFINQRSNLRLDWTPGSEGYAVFGEVIEGMQVVDIIALTDTGSASVETSRGPAVFQDVPVNPIVVLSVSRMAP